MKSKLQLDPPQRLRVVDAIIEQIVRQIRDGALAPGDRLPSERELVAMLNVSRSTVREALHALQAMNLIEGRVGAGTFVKNPLPPLAPYADVTSLSLALQREMRRHYTQARLALETEIVQIACPLMTPAGRDAILEATERNDREDSWETNDRLHLAIASATNNPVLVQLLQSLLESCPRIVFDKGYEDAMPEQRPDLMRINREIHWELGQAAARGDTAAARAMIQRHAANDEAISAAYFDRLLNGKLLNGKDGKM